MKEQTGECTPAMESMLEMVATYTSDVTEAPSFPGFDKRFFWNSYPEFGDTNNLSVVMFLQYGDLRLVFPGDLERAGWLGLLRSSDFRDQLRQVNVFIASHHGRESGYCQEVFEHCNPALIIISDTEHDDDSQEGIYARHASGIEWETGRRRVLTTHKHGMITLEQRPGQGATVDAARDPVRV